MDLHERILTADGAPGLYESNYLKANDPTGGGALWLKHNVLTPLEGPAVAEFWAVVWLAEEGWRPRVTKRVVELAQVDLAGDRIAVHSELAELEPHRATGDLGRVAWDLALRDELPPLAHLAPWMYPAPFPRKKLVTSSPRVVVDGHLDVAGRRIDVAGWVGHRQHNWGTEHALRYAYGSCNLWDDGADLTVEGFTIQVRLALGLRSPWLSVVTGLEHGEPYGRGDLAELLRTRGRVGWPRWVALGHVADGRQVRLRMRLDPTHAAGLRYLHPDGQVSYCYNVKDARVELRLGDLHHTSEAGELEFLVADPLPGIDLHGEGSLAQLRAALG